MKFSPPAKHSQIKKFKERRNASQKTVSVNGKDFIVLPGVYDASTDTELMSDVVRISKDKTFIEIGCGAGAIALLVAEQAKSGLGVDINPEAVLNSQKNKEKYKVKNVSFMVSDVFDSVDGSFDVIICNPPYNNYEAGDEVEMMFWDRNDEMKKKFFNQLSRYAKNDARIYFGWGDFEDLDWDFPQKQASRVGLEFVERNSRESASGRVFFVFEFKMG